MSSQLTRIINRKSIQDNPIEATHTNIESKKIEDALVELLITAVNIIKNEYSDNPNQYNDITVKENIQ